MRYAWLGDVLKRQLRRAALPLRVLANRFAARRGSFIIYRTGGALGEQVCMTAVIAELERQRKLCSIVVTNHPYVFAENPRVRKMIDVNRLPAALRKLVRLSLYLLQGSHIAEFSHPGGAEGLFREALNKRHLCAAHSAHFADPLSAESWQPEIFLAREEQRRNEVKFGLPPVYGVIHSRGKTDYTPNKEWDAAKFQEVVLTGPAGFDWVQVGVSGDPLLAGARDMRGRTVFRELAWIIRGARLIVCLEGLYAHLAAAFGVPCIVVHSGFIPPEFSNYKSRVLVRAETPPPCAPCCLRTPCPVPGHPCMHDIAAAQVAAAVRRELASCSAAAASE